MSAVVEIKEKPAFDALLASHTHVILQAHAVWCGPCKAITPLYNRHAQALSVPDKLAFAHFDIDDVPDLALELGIRTVPAFYSFENGDKSGTLGGAVPPALKKFVEDVAKRARGEDTSPVQVITVTAAGAMAYVKGEAAPAPPAAAAPTTTPATPTGETKTEAPAPVQEPASTATSAQTEEKADNKSAEEEHPPLQTDEDF